MWHSCQCSGHSHSFFQSSYGWKKVFNLAAQKLGFKFVAKKFPGGTILLHHVEAKERFPAQFGREVLAGLLNMADNVDWRNCKHNKQEEMKIVEDFKSRFQEYDPNC